jgi:uncharacterized protein (DUF2236 family)
MAFEAIMAEVYQLNFASDRIEGLASHHLPVSAALMSIAGNVRATATVLAVLVETKLRLVAGTTQSRFESGLADIIDEFATQRTLSAGT